MEDIREERRLRRRAWIGFAIFNAVVLVCLLLFPLYCKYMWDGAGQSVSVCLFKNIFKLYCPFCGSTRALWELLHLDFWKAVTYNPFLVIAFACFAFCDIRVFVNLLKGRTATSIVPPAITRSLLWSALIVTVSRALLLVFWCYDPIGDLAVFWQAKGV